MSIDGTGELAEVYEALERIEQSIRLIPTNMSLEEIARQLEPILAVQVERCRTIELAQARIEAEFNRQETLVKQSANEIADQFRRYQERMQKDMIEVRQAATQCERGAAQCSSLAEDLSQRLLRTTSNVEGYLRHVGESSSELMRRQEREFTRTCERLKVAINRLKSAGYHVIWLIAGAALTGAILGALLASLLILARLQQMGLINQGSGYRP
jgi:Skp family chaperone for outer membrane proteins